VYCSMRLVVPFIALRQLGAVGAPYGRLLLPSIHGRTGLSGVHRNVNSTRTRRDKESPDWLVFASRGHRTVRCACRPLASANMSTSRCTARAPDCPTPHVDGPLNYSRRRLKNPRAASLAGPCTGPSGTAQSNSFSLFLPLSSFVSFGLDFAEFLALRQI
jgi:hypothetical protein